MLVNAASVATSIVYVNGLVPVATVLPIASVTGWLTFLICAPSAEASVGDAIVTSATTAWTAVPVPGAVGTAAFFDSQAAVATSSTSAPQIVKCFRFMCLTNGL